VGILLACGGCDGRSLFAVADKLLVLCKLLL